MEKIGESKKIEVSDEFVDIYKNFNISSQIEKMKMLSKRELYLLLILCLDYQSDEDPVCINNYLAFTKEIQDILEVQDEKETTIQELKDLIKETDDKYIDVDLIVDRFNNKMPDPLELAEVRDGKIDNLLDPNNKDWSNVNTDDILTKADRIHRKKS